MDIYIIRKALIKAKKEKKMKRTVSRFIYRNFEETLCLIFKIILSIII